MKVAVGETGEPTEPAPINLPRRVATTERARPSLRIICNCAGPVRPNHANDGLGPLKIGHLPPAVSLGIETSHGFTVIPSASASDFCRASTVKNSLALSFLASVTCNTSRLRQPMAGQ